jgi:hypothetical protein
MSNEPKAMTARERLMLRLAQPIPRVKPNPAKELEEAKRRNCEILELIPGKGEKVGKPWRPYVDKASSYRQMDRTAADEMWELQRRVGEAARRARMRSDPFNLYGDRPESIDDVVRRQDETR